MSSDLRERLQRAERELSRMVSDLGASSSAEATRNRIRLGGKVEGISLALSYLDEEDRMLRTEWSR